MISVRRPSPDRLSRLLHSLADAPHSYDEVGATRGSLPSGYNVDRNRIRLGTGSDTFRAAKQALQGWAPFRIPWIEIHPQPGGPAEGVAIAVVTRIVGLWWINVSRVVYRVDEPQRFGFAYGTLGHHAERGEERFLVEQDPESGEVFYSILAFSRPRHILAKLGYPLARAAQRRFARDSLAAMKEATR